MWKVIKGFFKCYLTRDDEFVWALAQALLWRDENPSMAAIPAPIKEQPDATKYYDDALYLIKSVSDRWDEQNSTRDIGHE